MTCWVKLSICKNMHTNCRQMQLPINWAATRLAAMREVGLAGDDFFVGNVIILGPPSEDGDETDAPEYLVRRLVPGERKTP